MIVTIQDIIDLLPILRDRGWRASGSNGSMLRDYGGRCPLCALANEIDPRSDRRSYYFGAIADMGISITAADAQRLVHAADNTQLANPALRRKIANALGVPQ